MSDLRPRYLQRRTREARAGISLDRPSGRCLKRRSARGCLALAALALPLALGGCKKDPNAFSLPATANAAPAKASVEEAPNSSATSQPSTAGPGTTKLRAQVMAVKGDFGVLTGNTRPAKSTNLAPQISGLVRQILVQEGDVVQKGQILVQLDRSDMLLHLRQAQAAKATAEAQLAAVRTEWRRLKSLLGVKAIPRGQFDKVDSQLQIATAGLAQASVAIALASSALRKATIRAPFAGVIVRKLTEVGSYATVMPPSPVVQLQQLDPIEVMIQVPEAEMRKVTVKTPVRLRFSALGKTVESTITRVIPSIDLRTRSFVALVSLPNPQHELRPGMFVDVSAGGSAAGGSTR